MALRLYADDTTSYNSSDASSIAFQFMVNQDLLTLITWFKQNYLSINYTKTQALILGSSTYEYEIQISGIKVDVKPTLKILGVSLDI